MTDLDRFIALYKSFGIDLKISEEPHLKIDSNGNPEQAIELSGWPFTGYTGFHSYVHFDMNGKFKEQGFWE